MSCPVCNKKFACVAAAVSHMRAHVKTGDLKEDTLEGKVIFIAKNGSKFLASGEPFHKPVAKSDKQPAQEVRETKKETPKGSKICPVCKAKLSNSSAAAIAHLRSHVRKNELTEEKKDGHLEFVMGNNRFSLSSL